MKLILTLTQQEYTDYCSTSKEPCKRISGLSDLRGLTSIKIYAIGQYKSRTDWEDIFKYCTHANIRIERVRK